MSQRLRIIWRVLFPKVIKNSNWQVAFVGCFVPPSFDNGLGLRVDDFAFEIVVDLVIGNAKCDFISQTLFVFFQVRSRNFEVEFFICPQFSKKLFSLTFVEAEEGRMSAPPSPCLVKKPVIFSAAWSVPITAPYVHQQQHIGQSYACGL